MSLLLTRHVDQYGIDVRRLLRLGARPDGVRTTGAQPFTDQLAVETVLLDDQHPFHRCPAS